VRKTKAVRSKQVEQSAREDTPPAPVDRSADFERAIKQGGALKERYVLRLYVTGSTLRSNRAIQNIHALLEEHLHGKYDLEVIDIYQQPVLARGEQIIAAPTLIKKLPEPLRKVIGDLSNTQRVLVGLNLQAAAVADAAQAEGPCDG
jgi:circadian clock protein KaiB